ncbi:helix-turn-helix domain-containing protein [uncultured Dysosmobacter sp.]|uniref:helix-turn-helix domain-containing protein n=1 Tax=uncultured Dysosmobacter sp. TaxID=2591384 RepID=UPI00262420A6|nr:helix-turn-helix transcriptional regulator [uncultured Dysosmobacter sp.]
MKIYRYAGRCNASGLKIKRIREKREITQEQLAAKMQIEGIPLNQKAISRIEAGSRVVADYELMIFAKVLGVPVADLLKE